MSIKDSGFMRNLGFIGKLMFVIPMGFFGFGHLGNANEMAGMVPGFMPMSVIWVYLTGMGLVLAAIAIIIGKKAQLAGQLLGLMLVLFALMIHLPLAMDGDQGGIGNFFKDIALGGAAWFMSARSKE